MRRFVLALRACAVPLSFALAVLLAVSPPTAAKTRDKAAAKSGDEAPEWTVDDPPLPTSEVPIDVRSGTWLNLDVSPDGREIVFDLLGDLYVIPIEGGEARALTSGMAWDMQPRYSPDGSRITFTSDRGGGDNIWIVDRDGTDPVQVTDESFRLLNEPAWSPDGEFVIARKHFTSDRSIGAGEIWLYHRSGGSGIQLTERPNEQKDVGEPVFSVDGRYVFYSRDSTPGDVFQYNKDPNGQIYTIHRLDRETGESEVYIGGPGGAVRPTPSPDGTRMAFVRRVRAHTVLFVHDLASGRNTPLWDGLDRDMQETWAIHGVYPTMAWTPDSHAIVVWAGGGFHRVDAATGEVAEIPFHVKSTRRVAQALRFPVDVAPDLVDLKMLRWVDVSPAGDRVVYQALGRLWIRDFPDGEPRRLTSQQDHFEFYPSFSRDGRWIVYTTWNDRELGSVRIAPASGGEGRVVTTHPGHYVEPALSPDGSTVVYRAAGGGYIRSPLWSHDQGLFAIPTDGGAEPVRLSRTGLRPHFGSGSDRVYFMTMEPEDHRALRGIELDGSDERTLVTSEAATEFRVSPDGRWLAFTERFNAFITPFVAAGHAVEMGPKATSIPVSRVSRDAGEYLHWSGDSTRLYWSLGPELYERDLADAFAFLAGAPEKLPDPPEHGRPIGFSVPADVPRGTLAFVGARLVTMRGDEVIERGTIVVEDNRIAAVGPVDEVAVPGGATVIDAAGRTIVPGFVDVHWHGPQGSLGITPQRDWKNDATLAFGVTTIHDPSNDTDEFFAAAEMQRAGLIVAPRLFSTGTILYGAAGDFKAEIDSLDDARSHLRRMRAVGAFSVKSYSQPRRDQRQQILAAARELKMMVVPEGGSLFEHNMTMVVDGHTGVEHAIPVAKIYDDVVQLWSQTDVGYTPTIIVGYGGIWGERYWYQHDNVWEHEKLSHFVPRFVLDPRSRRREMAPEDEFNQFDIARACKQLVDRGVHVNIGAHGQREGLGADWEMWMLAQGGLTPMQVLHAATIDGARYLGLDGGIGSLEVGKLADLAVLAGNPLESIHQTDSVVQVMVNGRLYDAATMDEIAPRRRPRPAAFWEN